MPGGMLGGVVLQVLAQTFDFTDANDAPQTPRKLCGGCYALQSNVAAHYRRCLWLAGAH